MWLSSSPATAEGETVAKTKRDLVSGIVYNIPTPEEAKALIAEGRELRRELEKQLAPMSRHVCPCCGK